MLTTPFLATILRRKQIKREAKRAEAEGRKGQLMTQIEKILEDHPQKTQYRDNNKKVRFNLEWSMLMGHTTNALGAKSFETPHKKVGEFTLSRWKSAQCRSGRKSYGPCPRNSLV